MEIDGFTLFLYTLLVAYTTFFVIATSLFIMRADIHPIKARFPMWTLLSGVGGYLIVLNFSLAYLLPGGLAEWPCAVSHWVLWVAYPLFFMPYLIRAWRLLIVYREYERKTHMVDVRSPRPPATRTIHSPSNSSNRFAPPPRKYLTPLFLSSFLFGAIMFVSLISGIYRFASIPSNRSIGCLLHEDDGYSRVVLFALFLAANLLATYYLGHHDIRDEFNILRELQVVCIIWFVLIVPILIILVVIQGGALDGSKTVIFQVMHTLAVICVILCFLVTNVWPLNKTFQRGAQSLREAGSLEIAKIFTDGTVLSTLRSTLTDLDCRAVFKEFVQREFNSENFLYYFEIEHYKKIDASNLEELEEHAHHLYDMYLGPDADMKINISSAQMKAIDDALKNGRISKSLFDDTQREIFDLMERDSFQRFKQSTAFANLKKSLDSKGLLLVRLKEENMI